MKAAETAEGAVSTTIFEVDVGENTFMNETISLIYTNLSSANDDDEEVSDGESHSFEYFESKLRVM